MNKRLTGKIAPEKIRMATRPEPPADLVRRFQRTGPDSSLVSDVMDAMGLIGALPASVLAPSLPGNPVVGPATTVRNRVLVGDQTAHQRAAAGFNGMAEMEGHNLASPGDIIVIEGVTGLSNMGGVSAQIAQRQGVVGAVVQGGIRDLNHSREIGFPLWATEISPITGKWRIETIEINGDVSICGILVRPGDLIVADDSGVCVIPIERAAEIVAECERKFDLEQKRLGAIADGSHIADLPGA